MSDFDAYLMVDWSASSKPARGADSVWYGLVVRKDGALDLAALENPRTRQQATREVCEILQDLTARERSVLVGFDFPYCYPAGYAAGLGLECEETPWRAIWNELAQHIVDLPDNSNNRFEIAAGLNGRVSGEPWPFWGCTERFECQALSRYKGVQPPTSALEEFRVTDRRGTKQPQPVWKLAGVGSVGSQSLLGIPYLAKLRDAPQLAAVSRVWPFETGLQAPPSRAERGWLVLHAEIYPSLLKVRPDSGEIRDAAQVRNLAQYFAQADENGWLPNLLAGPPSLMEAERRKAETQEGWILGITDSTLQSSFGDGPPVAQRHRGHLRERAPQRLEPNPSIRRAGVSKGTTAPGYKNKHGQTVLRATGLRGTDYGQYVYVLKCGHCDHEYGANGSDVWLRRCPQCQGGRSGFPY